MALKIVLKPHERMIIGGAVIKNGNSKAEFFIENKPALLREKDILAEKDADTPARKIYFTIQLMYIDQENLIHHHTTYWQLVQKMIKAAPSTLEVIDQISETILGSHYYQALKLTRKLIDYEQEILNRV
jgi:flagellar protein FlbT